MTSPDARPADPELARAGAALHTQWDRLRAWVGEVAGRGDAPVVAARASVLAGWTTGELVAHLGRAMEALAVCEPAPDGTVPLSLAEYLGQYADRATSIADVTRSLAADIAADPLGGVDARAAAAFATLDDLGPADRVVQARRGPVLLSTMTVSRVIELVVHADDLARSVDASGAGSRAEDDPVDPAALDLVADELLRIVVARGGWSLEVVDARTWVRLATGRTGYDVDALARSLRPRFTGDAVPDLGRTLPLL